MVEVIKIEIVLVTTCVVAKKVPKNSFPLFFPY
jgi:hypothetical protein